MIWRHFFKLLGVAFIVLFVAAVSIRLSMHAVDAWGEGVVIAFWLGAIIGHLFRAIVVK